MLRYLLTVTISLLFFHQAHGLTKCDYDLLNITIKDNTDYWCDSENNLMRADKLFPNGGFSSQVTYKDGKIINRKTFNIEQKQTFEADIEENKDGSYVLTQLSLKPFRGYIIEKSHKINIEGEYLPQVIAKWTYDITEGESSKLKNYFLFKENTQILAMKANYDEQGLNIIQWIKFYYDNPNETKAHEVTVIAFDILDENKKIISHYTSEGPYTFADLYQGDLPDYKPLGIVIVDSGYEVDHPLLKPYWYLNPDESFDGKDNDGNGMVDDVYGFEISGKGIESANIREV